MNNNIFQSENINNEYDNYKDFSDVSNEKIKDISIEIRLGFIRKVYGILSSQLLLTSILSFIAMVSKSYQNFLLNHLGLIYFFLFLIIVISFIIQCCSNLMQSVPQNYIILFLFTFAESYVISFICAFSNHKLVFMAAFMTFVMCLSLTLYAINTKSDFTTKGGLLFILCAGLILFSIFGLFTNNKFFHILISTMGVILFGFYLIYDTQLIIGNKSELIEMDDYILGAFQLYLDIINIFLYLLDLLNSNN
jgi:hypothetical protein